MSQALTLARPYARAAFAIAREEGKPEKNEADDGGLLGSHESVQQLRGILEARRLLDKRQAQKAHPEIDIRLHVAGDGRHMMDSAGHRAPLAVAPCPGCLRPRCGPGPGGAMRAAPNTAFGPAERARAWRSPPPDPIFGSPTGATP